MAKPEADELLVLGANSRDVAESLGTRVHRGEVYVMAFLDRSDPREYFRAPFSSFIEPAARARASRVLDHATRLRSVMPSWDDEQKLQVWSMFSRVHLERLSPHERASVLLLWIIRFQDPAYVERKKHIADAFVEWFGVRFEDSLEFPVVHGLRTTVRESLTGSSRLDRAIDLEVRIRGLREDWLAQEERENLTRLAEDVLPRTALLLAGFASGAIEAAALAYLVNVLLNLLDLVLELEEGQEDGVVTEHESTEAWITAAGVFLPLGALFRSLKVRVSARVLETSLEVRNTYLTLEAIYLTLAGLLERWAREREARAAGASRYDEVIDSESTLFIPPQQFPVDFEGAAEALSRP